jgi:hypothetical protein
MKLREFVLRADLEGKRGRFADFSEGTDPRVMNALEKFFFSGLGMYGVTEVDELEFLGFPIDLGNDTGFYLLGYFRRRNQNERGAPFHGALIPFEELRVHSLREFYLAWKQKSVFGNSDWLRDSKVGWIDLVIENQRIHPLGEEKIVLAQSLLSKLEEGQVIRTKPLSSLDLEALFIVLTTDGNSPLFRYAWSTVPFGLPGEPDGAFLHLSRSLDGSSYSESMQLDLQTFTKAAKLSEKGVDEKFQYLDRPKQARGGKWVLFTLVVLSPLGYFFYMYQDLQFTISRVEKNMQPAYFQRLSLEERADLAIDAQILIDEDRLGSDKGLRVIKSLPELTQKLNQELLGKTRNNYESIFDDTSLAGRWYKFIREDPRTSQNDPKRNSTMKVLWEPWFEQSFKAMERQVRLLYPKDNLQINSINRDDLLRTVRRLETITSQLEPYNEFHSIEEIAIAKHRWVVLEFDQLDKSSDERIRAFGKYICKNPQKGFLNVALSRIERSRQERIEVANKKFEILSRKPRRVRLQDLKAQFLSQLKANQYKNEANHFNSQWIKYFAHLEAGILVQLKLSMESGRMVRDLRVPIMPVLDEVAFPELGVVISNQQGNIEILCPFQLSKSLKIVALEEERNGAIFLTVDGDDLVELALNKVKRRFRINGITFSATIEQGSNPELILPGL